MRVPIYGRVIPGATVAVNVAGGGAASVYAAAVGGSPGSTVTADDTGNAVFYYDDTTYKFPAFFDLSITASGFDTVTRTNVWNFFESYVSSSVDVYYSELMVCNMALMEIGADEITSLSDLNTRARACSRLYSGIRDAVLRAYPWNCAMNYVVLSVDATAPPWGYAYRYALPSTCLRALALDDPKMTFKVVGRWIYTNDTSLEMNLRFTGRVTDPSYWDALLVQAVVARLASALSFPVVGSKELEKLKWQLYLSKLQEARGVDGQEGSIDSIISTEFTDFRQ